jgi:hypothetical protein
MGALTKAFHDRVEISLRTALETKEEVFWSKFENKGMLWIRERDKPLILMEHANHDFFAGRTTTVFSSWEPPRSEWRADLHRPAALNVST